MDEIKQLLAAIKKHAGSDPAIVHAAAHKIEELLDELFKASEVKVEAAFKSADIDDDSLLAIMSENEARIKTMLGITGLATSPAASASDKE